MYAKTAAYYLQAYCELTFTDSKRMESTMATGSMIDCFDHLGYGSHKYIPADKLTEQLNMPKGAGVYGYWEFADHSYLLLTCPGPVAFWSGKVEDLPEFCKPLRKEKI